MPAKRVGPIIKTARVRVRSVSPKGPVDALPRGTSQQIMPVRQLTRAEESDRATAQLHDGIKRASVVDIRRAHRHNR